MSKVKTILIGLGVGAGAMYLMDPRHGKRRQAMIRDQFISLAHDTDNMVDKGVRDMRNRARGMVAEAYSMLSDYDTSDWLTEQRVRSEIGRLIPYSRLIDVVAHKDRVVVRGPILVADKAYVMGKINAIRGVKTIEDQLQGYESEEAIPGYQVDMQSQPGMQGNARSWSPTARLIGSLAGAGMMAFGGSKGGIVGSSMSIAGIGLVARSISNRDLGQLVGISSEPGAVSVQKSINIDAPVQQVYEFWNNYENFPRFMDHLKSIQDIGGGMSHWVAKGPANSSVEWDALEVQNIPNKVISWRSTPESQVKTEGSVRFRENQMGGTTINVHMVYTPPAGVIGHAVAVLFGDNPKQAMDEDLMKLKSLLEEGKTTGSGKEVTTREL